jgi:hypothetical protein
VNFNDELMSYLLILHCVAFHIFRWTELKKAEQENQDLGGKAKGQMQISQFTAIAKLALRVLSIPASGAAVERVFSHGSLILSPYRSSLSDEHLSELVMLKCNPH